MAYLTQTTIIPKVKQFLKKEYPLIRDGGAWTLMKRARVFGYMGDNPREWFDMFLRDGRPIPESIYTAMGYRCEVIKHKVTRRYTKL